MSFRLTKGRIMTLVTKTRYGILRKLLSFIIENPNLRHWSAKLIEGL